MRLLLFLAELLLIVIAALFLGEMKYSVLEKILEQNGVDAKIYLKDIDTLLIENLSYQNRKIAKKIEIKILYAPLLQKEIYIVNSDIEGLDINNLLEIEPPKTSGTSSAPSFFLFIKSLRADGIYRYEGTNRFYLKASNITTNSADIEKLQIKSFAANAIARGRYEKSLVLKGEIFPKSGYLKRFKTPLNLKAVKKIDFFTKIDEKKTAFKLYTDVKNIYKETNATIKSKGYYRYKDNFLHTKNFINLLAFKSEAKITADANYSKELRYAGAATVQNGDYKLGIKHSFYKRVKALFSGNLQKSRIRIFNNHFKADVTYKKDEVEVNTSKIALSSLIDVPKELKKSYIRIRAKKSKDIKASISSDLFKSRIKYQKSKLYIEAKMLKKIAGVNLPALNPITVDADLETKRARIDTAIFKGIVENGEANITAKGAKIAVKPEKEDIKITASVNSLKTFLKTVSRLYPVEAPIESRFTLNASINPKSLRYKVEINSPWVASPVNRLTFLNLKAHGDRKNLYIDYYAITFPKHAFYATKTSHILFGDKIVIKEFWIEDALLVSGYYKDGDGRLKADAKNYHYSSVEGFLDLATQIDIKIKQNRIMAEGNVLLKGGELNIEPKKERSVMDKDIVVVDREQKGSDFFLNSVALNIKIDAQKPIKYKIPNLYLLFKPDILLWKEFGKKLEVLGYVDIIKGRYHAIDDYKILKSKIYFYSDPTDPLLDIHIKVKKDRYTIYITISGSLSNPIVSFDSEPYLEQKDILSLLLFNSSSQNLLLKAAGGDRLLSAFSNIFLKDILKSVGIKLDKLTLTTNGNRLGFEIGKKISDKITILYKNDEVSTIIISYEINDKLETEVIFGPQRSGINLFYKEIR